MSVYVPTFKSGNNIDIASLHNELATKLPSRLALDFNTYGSLQSTSSNGYFLNQSFDCDLDDLVDVDMALSLSASSPSIGLDVSGRIDGTIYRLFSCYGLPGSGTGGQGIVVPLSFKAENLSGTKQAQIYVNIWAGSGTVYTRQQWAQVTTTKKR